MMKVRKVTTRYIDSSFLKKPLENPYKDVKTWLNARFNIDKMDFYSSQLPLPFEPITKEEFKSRWEAIDVDKNKPL